MSIAIIAAMTKDRVIGDSGRIPWHLPEDLKLFKSLTLNSSIIMGRKTFESIGKILPERTSIVISNTRTYYQLYPKGNEEVLTVKNLEHALEIGKHLQETKQRENDNIFIIGGGEVYKKALELDIVDKAYLTIIERRYGGDVYFPNLNFVSSWELESQSQHYSNKLKAKYYYSIYKRRDTEDEE